MAISLTGVNLGSPNLNGALNFLGASSGGVNTANNVGTNPMNQFKLGDATVAPAPTVQPQSQSQSQSQPAASSSNNGQTTGGGTPAGGTYSAGFHGQQADPYASIKSGIGSAWDSYLGSLGDIGNTFLPQQQQAQQGIADAQLQQGQQTVNAQKAQSLKDIANTTRNAFQAGNNYLGSMGAGDSSAANQYAFAINQQAGKQTGDLNNFVNTQLQSLQNNHDSQINSIANWFSQQQEALKQQMAQGNLQKGQDLNNLSSNILNQAIAATNAIKANSQNQYNALLQWAANNSQGLGQLQQNIAAIPQAMGQINVQGGGAAAQPAFAPQGTPTNLTGNKDIFGNPLPN